MDKLSFASVYRTAAILAAFSRGDVRSDEPARREEPSAIVMCPVLSGTERRALWHILHSCWARARAWRSEDAQRAEWDATDTQPTGWWLLQRPAIAPRPQRTHGSPLVSHFAFSEDVDLHRTQPGSAASKFVR